MNNISVMYLLQLAWKRIWLLIVAMVVFAVAAFGYCNFFAIKKYSATAAIIVTNGNIVNADEEENYAGGTINGADLSASSSLSRSVVELLITAKAYDAFVEEYGDKYDISKGSVVKEMTTVARRESSGTPFIDITVTSTDPNLSKDIANDIAEFACRYVVEDYFKKAEIVTADEAKSAELVYPKTAVTTGIAALVGVVVMYIIVLIFDSLNQSIRGEEEFAMKFDIPIIGSVPDFGDTEIIDSYYKKGGYGSVK